MLRVSPPVLKELGAVWKGSRRTAQTSSKQQTATSGEGSRRSGARGAQDPISRILCAPAAGHGHRGRRTSSLWDDRCRSPRAADLRRRFGGPPVSAAPKPSRRDASWLCTPWGLPGRGCHQPRRCALTAPFHPLPHRKRRGGTALCCTCRRPCQSRDAFRLGSTVPCRVRTFLTASCRTRTERRGGDGAMFWIARNIPQRIGRRLDSGRTGPDVRG